MSFQPSYSRVPTSQPHSSYHNDPYHSQTNEQFAQPNKHEPHTHSSASSSSSSSSSPSSSFTGYRDWPFAVLFISHLLILLFFGFSLFRSYWRELSVGSSVRIDYESSMLLASIIAVGAIVSIGWLMFVRNHARELIWFTLVLGIIFSAVTVVLSILSGSLIATIFSALFLLLNCFYVYSVRPRIPFSATILELSIKCIQLYPSTIAVAILGIIFQILWVVTWTICAFSIFHSLVREPEDQGSGRRGQGGEQDANNSLAQFVGFLLLVSLYWTGQVIKNIVHCTVAGVQGVWYFVYPNPYPNPTLNAMKRSCTTSFGSICFGSLILSVIRAVRAVLSAVANQRNEQEERSFAISCIIWIAQCLLDIVDAIVEYLNMYAFVQVGLYGKDFISASKDTWALMQRSGFAALINDSLISSVLSFGALIGGLICALLSGIFSYFLFSNTPSWGLWVVLAFLIGTVLTMTVMTVVESAVVTLFVCFAQDPEALMRTKPEEYERLSETTGARIEGQI